MSDVSIELLNQIVDLKVERAVSALVAEVRTLGAAHNKLATEIVPPLVADLEKRKADAKQAEEEAAKAKLETLERKLAEADEKLAKLREEQAVSAVAENIAPARSQGKAR